MSKMEYKVTLTNHRRWGKVAEFHDLYEAKKFVEIMSQDEPTWKWRIMEIKKKDKRP